MPMKLILLGVALIAGTLLSNLASAQDELPAAQSSGPTTGLNEIPQLRGPIINQPDTISASTSMTDKPEEMNTVLRRHEIQPCAEGFRQGERRERSWQASRHRAGGRDRLGPIVPSIGRSSVVAAAHGRNSQTWPSGVARNRSGKQYRNVRKAWKLYEIPIAGRLPRHGAMG